MGNLNHPEPPQAGWRGRANKGNKIDKYVGAGKLLCRATDSQFSANVLRGKEIAKPRRGRSSDGASAPGLYTTARARAHRDVGAGNRELGQGKTQHKTKFGLNHLA